MTPSVQRTIFILQIIAGCDSDGICTTGGRHWSRCRGQRTALSAGRGACLVGVGASLQQGPRCDDKPPLGLPRSAAAAAAAALCIPATRNLSMDLDMSPPEHPSVGCKPATAAPVGSTESVSMALPLSLRQLRRARDQSAARGNQHRPHLRLRQSGVRPLPVQPGALEYDGDDDDNNNDNNNNLHL